MTHSNGQLLKIEIVDTVLKPVLLKYENYSEYIYVHTEHAAHVRSRQLVVS